MVSLRGSILLNLVGVGVVASIAALNATKAATSAGVRTNVADAGESEMPANGQIAIA